MASLTSAIKPATPLVVTHGKGTYLYDEAGRAWLDFTAGIGVTATGHCHPAVVEAAKQQIERLIHGQYGIVRHQPLLRLMDRLQAVMPEGLDTFFFANSGAEAVEAAVRLARNATGRQNVVVFQGSFHGRTYGAASLTTSGARFRAAVSGPLPPGVVVAPFPAPFRYGWDLQTANEFCLRELDHLFVTLTRPEDTAAILIEPVQGEAGYLPASTAFFEGLRKRADQHDIMLIVDEVQAGMGRTGKYWSHEHFDVHPDIVVFAKGIASGFPLSGVAAREDVMNRAAPGSQGGTYSANAVACAAAIATLDVIEKEGLLDNAREMGKRLRDGLEATAARHKGIGDVRGLGLMQACEFVRPDGNPDPDTARAAVAAALERGLIVLTCGPYGHIVRMIPALTVSEKEIAIALETWSAAVDYAYAGG
ncbi:aspartate aminotransferase family protein [Paraburkholderia nodosa]|uniref:aspartate aminotransferase family protein n=1 Tax=Paraburkholderia nodosa TaxID=392320 RepID=UPI000483AEE0|nr:aminotransferase class III-fold pyridoxal phosphate-dependent enzyme [Paraburkholderia nodosa]